MTIYFNITIISSFFILIQIIIIIIITLNHFGLEISKLFFKTTILEGLNIHFTTFMEMFLIWWLSPYSHINSFKNLFNYWSWVIRIYINIIIIIIMSRRQRGYPWPSLAISPNHSSPPAGLQGYIIVAVCKFVLVVPLLHIHMWGSTGVHRLWARPCFSSSVPRVWFVWLV